MTGRPPTVPGNLRHLQDQINRFGTAPLGPVSVGPGEGHVRAYTETGTTFQIFPDGASFAFRGGLVGLSPHLEANATKNEQQDGRLDGHDSTLASHGSRLTTAEGRLDGHDSTLASHASTLASHNTRITNAQARADKGVSDAAAAQSSANAAQSRADSAYTRAGTGISNAATAQARADDAYARAGTGISDAQAAQTTATQANARAIKIINCIAAVTPQGFAAGGSFSTMAAASEWQQLKNCIAN